jgi:TonB family protein
MKQLDLRFKSIWMVCLLFAFCPFVLGANRDQEETGQQILHVALERSLLHAEANSQFRISLNVKLLGLKSGPIDGVSGWLVAPGKRWRMEAVFSDYREAQIANGSSLWVKRTLGYRPLPAVWINLVFDNFWNSFELTGDDRITNVTKRRMKHEELHCVEIESDHSRTLCFDSTGNLQQIENTWLHLTYNYSDYRQVGNKWMPFRVEARRGDQLLLEGTLTETSSDPTKDLALFQPPSGSMQLTICPKYQGGRLSHSVQPVYPAGARQGHEQGTVILYALILKDGSLDNVSVIQTAGSELDDSALAAVRQWRYEPVMCGNTPIEKEALLTVHYNLKR